LCEAPINGISHNQVYAVLEQKLLPLSLEGVPRLLKVDPRFLKAERTSLFSYYDPADYELVMIFNRFRCLLELGEYVALLLG
jgi:hypothetical protein